MSGLFTKFRAISITQLHICVYIFFNQPFLPRQSATLADSNKEGEGQGEIICQNKFYKYSFWPSISKRNQNSFKLKEKNPTVLQYLTWQLWRKGPGSGILFLTLYLLSLSLISDGSLDPIADFITPSLNLPCLFPYPTLTLPQHGNILSLRSVTP